MNTLRPDTSTPAIGAVVLAYGDEPWLEACLSALLAEPISHLVVVDNGLVGAQPGLSDSRLSWIHPGRNTGFAGGCNLGAKAIAAQCDVLLFVNSDLVISESAPTLLAKALDDPAVGLACGLVLLGTYPNVINTAGNPIHFTMLSWAGQWGREASHLQRQRHVGSATGALLAIRSADWGQLRGLYADLFAYGEDVELSIRTWQSGKSVVCEEHATGLHYYEFTRNPLKMYLLERNRLSNLATLYEWSTLVMLAPALAVVEAGILFSAAQDGWLSQKFAGYRWLWKHRANLRERRRWVQAQRTRSDSAMSDVFTSHLDLSPLSGYGVPLWVDAILASWREMVWPSTASADQAPAATRRLPRLSRRPRRA